MPKFLLVQPLDHEQIVAYQSSGTKGNAHAERDSIDAQSQHVESL